MDLDVSFLTAHDDRCCLDELVCVTVETVAKLISSSPQKFCYFQFYFFYLIIIQVQMCCNLVFLCLFFIISCLIIKYEQIKSKITEFWMSRLQNSSKFKDSPPNMAGGPF